MNVCEILEERAEGLPEKVFLYFEDQEITFRQFNESVNKAANGLLRLGIRKKERVSMLLGNCPEFLYCQFGLLKIGAWSVPINIASKPPEVEYILNNSESNSLITSPDYLESVIVPIRDNCPLLERIICVGDKKLRDTIQYSEMIKCCSTDYELQVIDEENDIACIMHTSGTIGPPKGCMLPYGNFTGPRGIVDNAKVQHNDRFFNSLPLFHSNAQVLAVLPSIFSGASLILIDRFSSSSFWRQTRQYGATIFNYIGFLPAALSALPPADTDGDNPVRLAMGAGMQGKDIEEFERRFHLKVLEVYGTTESGVLTINPIDARKIGSQGPPFAFHALKIVDDKGNEMRHGTVGNILIKARGMLKGYYGDPERTKHDIIDGWYHSGDLGYLGDDGYLYFVDRKIDMIRRSGENISPFEVETVLRSHPKIIDAAVVPVPDKIRGQEVKALIILQRGETQETVPPEEVIRFCEERLSYFKVPRFIGYRKDFPRTPSKKTKKSLLKKETDLTKNCYDKAEKRLLG